MVIFQKRKFDPFTAAQSIFFWPSPCSISWHYEVDPLSCLVLESQCLSINPSLAGTRSRAPLSAAWGPDKSRLGCSCQQGEEVWGSTQGLALRNDAISACATVLPPPPHKLDPAEQVMVDSAWDRWVWHTFTHTCHHISMYGCYNDGEGGF